MKSKMWLVAGHEFRQNAGKKSFLLLMLSFPVVIVIFIGFVQLMVSLEKNNSPVGIVDPSGTIVENSSQPEVTGTDGVTFVIYSAEETAYNALKNDIIQAYFTLPPNYPESIQVRQVFFEQPGDNVVWEFYNNLRLNVLVAELVSGNQPSEIANRLTYGNDVSTISLQDQRAYPDDGPTFADFLPVIVSFGFLMLFITSAGYLVEAIFKERENRTIEVISTSIAPGQIVSGKILSVVMISLVLAVSWVVIGILGLYIAQAMDLLDLQIQSFHWKSILSVLIIALPSYVMVCGLMFAFGLLIGAQEETQQVGPMLMILYFLPFYLFGLIGEDPGHPISIGLSLAPFTSLMATGIRSMLVTVPLWQVLLSVTIQVIFAALAVWVAIRVFRSDWLRPGKRIWRRKQFRQGQPA